jgi:hypothetical protein
MVVSRAKSSGASCAAENVEVHAADGFFPENGAYCGFRVLQCAKIAHKKSVDAAWANA